MEVVVGIMLEKMTDPSRLVKEASGTMMQLNDTIPRPKKILNHAWS